MLKVLASGFLALALSTPLVAAANEYGYYGDDGHHDCDDRVRRHEVYRERHGGHYAPPVVAVRPAYPPPVVGWRPVPAYAYPPPYAWAPPVHRGYDRDDWHGDVDRDRDDWRGDHDRDDWQGDHDNDDWHHDRW
jgi:hypothetical protein